MQRTLVLGLDKHICSQHFIQHRLALPTLLREDVGPSTYVQPSDFPSRQFPGAGTGASAGAMQAVVQGSTPTEFFVGSANGGVWRTRDLSALGPKGPRWENVLDGQPVRCTSIAALAVADFDTRLVFAGCGGATSSEVIDSCIMLNRAKWKRP